MLWVPIPFMRDVLDTTLCDKVFQWLATGRWYSPNTIVSSTNKTDHHNITEILLKAVLITITLTRDFFFRCQVYSTLQSDSTQVRITITLTTVTCDRSVVFFEYSGFLHQKNWPPQYSWNIVENGVKHHKTNQTNQRNCIGGVMVSMLTSSVVDHGFEPWAGQTKDYKIGICSFPAKHASLSRKNKYRLAKIRIMCQSGATCLSPDCCFSELALLKSSWSSTKRTSSSHRKLTCSRRDIAEKLLSLG